MLTFAYYILKVIICSGILYGYYLLALRNKVFHRWNRFYLLAAVVLSLAAPLIKINIWPNSGASQTQVIHLIQAVSTGDEFVYEYTRNNSNIHINATNLSVFIYTIISGLLLAFLIQTLVRIKKLKHKYQLTIVEGINFINTDARGTPFSFFNNIFWNTNIDLNTSAGKQIFRHEVVHVHEKHSYDKIFMNLVLIFFWCNPVFWLIRRELNMIHEFIADKKAVEDNDTGAFAAMILQATYPQQRFTITNNFFYSPLKRRLAMLTKNKNPKINYLSRLLVLPLAALVFFAFTLKVKTTSLLAPYAGKKITVVIDAGHGGSDNGVIVNNIAEKEITLAIAKKIKELNTNENINIVLSREEDKSITPKERIDFTKKVYADLFISIHIDAEVDKHSNSGISVLIPKNENQYLTQSKILGSQIIEAFKNNYQLPVSSNLKQRERNVLILKANEYPAVLIEAGVLTTENDLQYLIKAENQKIIAHNILNAIEKYAQFKLPVLNDKATIQYDTIPKMYYKNKKVTNLQVYELKNKVIVTYNDGTKETITKEEADKRGFVLPPPPPDDSSYKRKGQIIQIENEQRLAKQNDSINIIYVIDGQIYDKEILTGKKIQAKSGKVYQPNNEEAIKLYGNAAKNGVMVFTDAIITDKEQKNDTDTIPKNLKTNKVFTKVEVDPSFPGGEMAWQKYITKIMTANIDELAKDNKAGTCRVRFIVDVDGSVRDIKVLSMQETKLAEISENAIRKGPKWIPAKQNGHVVTAYREQPITFTISEN